MSEVVRSAARVLDLLEFFAAQAQSYTLAEVASRFNLPKSSALGLLRTLASRGYLVRDDQGRYTLNSTFRAQGFGWGGDHLARLSAIALPHMTELAETLQESITLGSIRGNGLLQVYEQTLSNQAVRYEAPPDVTFPAYCTAMGRVLMSTWPRERQLTMLERQPRVALTPHTVIDLDALLARIELAARDGYSVVEEECERGGTGMAMAIRDHAGQGLAALNVAFVSARFAEKREQALITLRERVTQIEQALRGTNP